MLGADLSMLHIEDLDCAHELARAWTFQAQGAERPKDHPLEAFYTPYKANLKCLSRRQQAQLGHSRKYVPPGLPDRLVRCPSRT